MKQGRTLEVLAKEIEKQYDSKRDFAGDTRQFRAVVPQTTLAKNDLRPVDLNINGHGLFRMTEWAHRQIASRLGIPAKYYDRMRAEVPGLLTDNINTWFNKNPEHRMVRTIYGTTARAFLSSKYRPLDNMDLAKAVIPFIRESGCRVESCELTDTRLYLKAIAEGISTEIIPGRRVQAGVVISNSEVGAGSVRVEPLIFEVICTNGMIVTTAFKKYHIGRSGSDYGDEGVSEFYTSETRKADDRALWMKVTDVVKGVLGQDGFESIVARYRATTGNPIEGDPIKAVEVLGERLGLGEAERKGVLTNLIKEGMMSQYGLINAITRTAEDVKDYDRATELERMGCGVMELPKQDWERIARAGIN